MHTFGIFFITILLALQSRALYFHIGLTESKCFIEEIPDDTLLVGRYRVEIRNQDQNKFVPTAAGFGMHVEIRDPDKQLMLSRTYSDRGQFSTTSQLSGEHSICLKSNATSTWFSSGQLRVHMDIQVGEHAQDYYNIAAKEKLGELQLRIRQLFDQVKTVAKEQLYHRHRETIFREISDSTNRRVLWWSVLQTIVLLATGFLQMRHLKSFFVAKKLV